MKKLISIFVIFGLAVTIWAGNRLFGTNLPSYSWHQKMTLEVEVEGKTYTGSSVVWVGWRKNTPFGAANGPTWIRRVKGEAAFVEVSGHGVLFALLNVSGGLNTGDLAFKLVSNGARGTVEDKYRRLKSSVGKPFVLSEGEYPLLVTFGDLGDPASVKRVDPSDQAATLGPEYKLKSITLMIVEKGVMAERIESLLPWFLWTRKKFLARGGGTNPLKMSNSSPRGYRSLGRTRFKIGR